MKTNELSLPRRLGDAAPSPLRSLRLRAGMVRARNHPVIDLATGNVEVPPPAMLHTALRDGDPGFVYGSPAGELSLRAAVAHNLAVTQGLPYNAELDVTITGGATGALGATLLALVENGDCVAMFEPFFEPYVAQVQLAGGIPKYVPLRGSGWTFDEEDLNAALAGRTRFLILNAPHNPTGKMFSKTERDIIARLCHRHNVTVISDETYAPFVFAGSHVSIAATDGMYDRTVLIHSWSKALNAPGWRVGSVTAPAPITAAIRRACELSSGPPPAPVQNAFAAAMPQFDAYMRSTLAELRPRRLALIKQLRAAGFTVSNGAGGLNLWASGRQLAWGDDVSIAERLLEQAGILCAPGSMFFAEHTRRFGATCHHVRFNFARSEETMQKASAALDRLRIEI